MLIGVEQSRFLFAGTVPWQAFVTWAQNLARSVGGG